MKSSKENDDKIRCSFCNKTQDQVRKLIAGPSGAYICDECVDICMDIIEDVNKVIIENIPNNIDSHTVFLYHICNDCKSKLD